MTIYGIDPGKQGAICALLPHGGVRFHRLLWDGDFLDFRLVQQFIDETTMAKNMVGEWKMASLGQQIQRFAFIERPLVASLGRSSNSILHTGICYGRLSAVFEHLGIPVREMSPQEWHGQLGLKFPKGESKAAVETWVRKTFPLQDIYAEPFTSKAANLGARDALGIAMAGKKLMQKKDL